QYSPTIPPPPTSTLFPYTTLFRSALVGREARLDVPEHRQRGLAGGRVARRQGDVSLGNGAAQGVGRGRHRRLGHGRVLDQGALRSEEHMSELQSRGHLVCRLLLVK